MESTVWLFGILVIALVPVILLAGRLDQQRRRLDALDRKLSLLPEYRALESQLSAWQKLALDPSSKIQAIKAYCDATGAGLAEAKAAVENWLKAR